MLFFDFIVLPPSPARLIPPVSGRDRLPITEPGASAHGNMVMAAEGFPVNHDFNGFDQCCYVNRCRLLGKN
jgi:hypothetical protein